MNFKIGGDEIAPNIKGENTFFHNSFLLVKLWVFYFKQCVKKIKIKNNKGEEEEEEEEVSPRKFSIKLWVLAQQIG